MKKYKYEVTIAYVDNYEVSKYEDGKFIGNDIVPYYNLDSYTNRLESAGYIKMLDDDLTMNLSEFINYCKDGRIECPEQILGLLSIFGECSYIPNYNLLQNQILDAVGYELLIRKKCD